VAFIGGGASAIAWRFTGLQPNTSYDLRVFGQTDWFGPANCAKFTVGATTITLTAGQNYADFTTTSDGSGVINGTFASGGGEFSSMSGIQILGSDTKSGYATWAGTNGLDPAHPEAVGHDGLTNLMVYALDLKTDGTNGSPGTLASKVLSFTKRPEAVTNGDVTYAIEVSTDLGVTDLWHVTTTGVTEVAGPPLATIAIDLSALGGTSHFARLKVMQTP